MSKSPLIDEAARKLANSPDASVPVWFIDLARQLERQNTKLRQQIADLQRPC